MATLRPEIPALIVGGLIGGLVGYFTNVLQEWLNRPRLARWGFVKRTPQYEDGYLHKFWFELKGRRAPGACSLEIRHEARDGAEVSRFAKWDEAGKPRDISGNFWMDKVPDTYDRTIHVGRIYTVPIVLERQEGSYLFNAWWYGRAQHPGMVTHIDMNGVITLSLSGQGLGWKRRFEVQEVMSGPTLNEADSDSQQGVVRRFLERYYSRARLP